MMDPEMSQLLLISPLLVIFSYIATGQAAETLWLTDKVKARSNHRRPASRAGGLVVTLVICGALMLSLLLGWPWPPAFAVMALAAALFGTLDDVSDIPARMKMAALIVLCAFAAAITGPVSILPLPMGGEAAIPPAFGYVLSTVFLFGFLNAFNFMDGLNGMAGGAGLIGLCLLIVIKGPEAPGLVFLYVLSAAALYGFLVRNILKGGIFLGDAGSLGLAMLLGAGSLEASQTRPEAVYLFAIAFLPFLLDVFLTFSRRAARGAPVMEAHKEHHYQRLRAGGWSHQAVSGAYALLVLASGAMALFMEARWAGMGLWLSALGSAALTLLCWRMMYLKDAMPAGQQS